MPKKAVPSKHLEHAQQL